MRSNPEAIKREVDIVSYAGHIGLTPVKIGRWYTTKEHDSIRIDPERNLFYRNSTGEKGSVIDFAMTFGNMGYKEALADLSSFAPFSEGYIGQEKDIKSLKTENMGPKKLELPEKDDNMKNVFAYLVKTRKLDAGVVEDLIKKKMLYQDRYKNCVFVSYKNGEPVFANKRGTNTYKRFVADCSGSDYSYGFFIDNKSKNLVVTEGVIDALSVLQLNKDLGGENMYNYLAVSGATKYEKALEYHLRDKNYETVTVCLDADEAGLKAAMKIEEHIKQMDIENKPEVFIEPPPFGKDYNDYLLAVREEASPEKKEKVTEAEL